MIQILSSLVFWDINLLMIQIVLQQPSRSVDLNLLPRCRMLGMGKWSTRLLRRTSSQDMWKELKTLGNPSILVSSPTPKPIQRIGIQFWWFYLLASEFILFLEISGGCLRNMMAFEDSGIPWRRPCSLELGSRSIFPKKWLMTCHRISFLMENYGELFSLIKRKSSRNC